VLKEYGTKACICALKKKTLEREALKEIFFSVNQQTLTLESSRRDTLFLILEMIKECNKNQIVYDDWDFRNMIFYSLAS
jgi:hypothetical protein